MTFAERLEREEWWDEQESLLNLSDINMPPDYYTGSKWEWITEITAYIFREPETWQGIYRQYLVKAQQQGNTEHTRLNYYRDEEGYIRREREDETYLQISTTTADVAVLKRVGEKRNQSDILTEYLKQRLLRRANWDISNIIPPKT